MFIETGNAESFWPRLVGLKNWRYVVKDPMHHVFWNRDAIRYLAADLDLEVVNIESTHHRTDHGKSYGKRMRHWLELTLFGLSPGLYRTLARTMDRKTRYPPLPRTEDHIFCVLRKE